MTLITPNPVDREDGGTDFTMPSCPVPCYTVNKEGMSIEQCPFLKVKQGWVYSELYCEDDTVNAR